jgi:hypothetical protein
VSKWGFVKIVQKFFAAFGGFFNHRGRGYRKFFAAFGGCLTTEEGRLRE